MEGISEPFLGRFGECCGDENFPWLALSSLQLHQPQPEGEPQGAHPQQTRQPRGELRLRVLWQAPVQPQQPPGAHITGPQGGTEGEDA